jgi:hypothetical protein
MQSKYDRTIGALGVFSIVAISVGVAGAHGWPFGLMTIGFFALLIGLVAA